MDNKKIMAMLLATSTVVGVHLQKDEIAYADDNSSNNPSINNYEKTPIKGIIINVDTKLRVRKTPTEESSVVGHLENGKEFEIINNNGEWYEIKCEDVYGFIHKEFVNVTEYKSVTSHKGKVVNVESLLRIREGADASTKILEHLRENEKVDILGESNGWYKIKAKDKIGYVEKENIEVLNQNTNNKVQATLLTNKEIDETVDNKQVEGRSSYMDGVVVNVTSGLRIRSGANTTSRIIGMLHNNAKVKIASKQGAWYKIKCGNEYGYVHGDYIKVVGSNTGGNNNSSNTQKGNGKVVNVTSELRVRSKASTGGKVIGSLRNGASVNILGKEGVWYKIKHGSGHGYVHGDYIKQISEEKPNVNPDTSKPDTSKPDTSKPDGNGETYQNGKVVNVTSQLRVRQAANKNAKVIGSLRNNASLKIAKKEGEWYKIKYNNGFGYVHGDYVSLEKPVVPEPEKPVVPEIEKPVVPEPEKPQTDNSEETRIYTNYNMSLNEYVKLQQGRVPSYTADYFEEYINPNKAKNKYQFLRIDSFKGVNASALDKYLEVNDSGVLKGQANAFIAASKNCNIDPLYFVAQSIHETGYGKSTLAKGVTITEIADLKKEIKNDKGELIGYEMQKLSKPTTVYNLFGIGAYDNTQAFPNRALIAATTHAYNQGWTTVGKAIQGAAEFVGNNYIHNSKYDQNTVYKLRYTATTKYVWHQYATSPWYAQSIGEKMQEMEYIYTDKSKHIFDMPKFN